MKKQGPCNHCGISKTALWRYGPPEKPVLCNACGTMYRKKGTLENYVPKHGISVVQQSSKHVRLAGLKKILNDGSSASSNANTDQEDQRDEGLNEGTLLNAAPHIQKFHRDMLALAKSTDCLMLPATEEDVLIDNTKNVHRAENEISHGCFPLDAVTLSRPNHTEAFLSNQSQAATQSIAENEIGHGSFVLHPVSLTPTNPYMSNHTEASRSNLSEAAPS